MTDTSLKKQFTEQGYLVLEDLFDQKTIIEPVKREYETLLDELIGQWIKEAALSPLPDHYDFYDKLKACYEKGCDWFQPMDISLPADEITDDTPMHFGPAVFNMLTYGPLLDIVEQLIGSEITSNPIQHVRLKPPSLALADDEIRAHITATDWHQDRGVTHDEADETDMVTVWIAISDAHEENGCLQVIPRNHNDAYSDKLLPHCAKSQTAIADGFIDLSAAQSLPVRSGGIILFHPLTAHSSLMNRSDRFRWSFDIRFNRTGQPTGRSHFPDFIARSRAHPETELKDWQQWRQLWRDARSHLTTQPHTPLHRWASDAPFCA